MISEIQKHIIIDILQPFHPQMIGIFGSYARNENSIGSDLDILVEFKNTVNLLDIIGLEMKISEQLGIKVDLITKKAVPPKLEGKINKDVQRIF